MSPNERGHYPIAHLEVELGLWRGNYQNQNQLWLRWWDEYGNLLLTGSERAEVQRVRAERAEQAQAAEAQARRDAIPRLLAMGLTLEQIAIALSLTVEDIRKVSQE